VKLWRRSIAQQFEHEAIFKALEGGMACTKALRLAGTAWRVATRKSDAWN
jgi:hypothetical protein